MKKFQQVKLLVLVVLLLVSPILWIVLGNIPVDFNDTQSWIYLITFAVLALAVFFALDSNKK
ncbi:MAG: hypothetical protein WC087_02305 [Candidatus Paceibacterota bacterium]